jgi:hypothetical protein
MQDVIYKIKNMIALNTKLEMTEAEESYIAGLSDALEILETSVSENLVIGNVYYVIMYRDGNKFLPYIDRMKLYKVTQGAVKPSYCFTKNLESGRYHSNHPDLVLNSKKGVMERVFYTMEQAENTIHRN